MAKIIFNRKLKNENYYLMKVAEQNDAQPGQFYMLRAWELYPMLPRPLSIYDRDEKSVTFLYRIVGKGTEIMAKLLPGDEIDLKGPYGNSFELTDGKVALVGGGVGIAPLYLLAKELKKQGATIDIFFSLRGEEILYYELKSVCDRLVLKTNERVLKYIDYKKYDRLYSCGPEGMMRDITKASLEVGAKPYVSLERRMGCGCGICYVCSCQTAHGNRLVCAEGPVFKGEEIFYD